MGRPVWCHCLCLVNSWRLALCLLELALQQMHQCLSEGCSSLACRLYGATARRGNPLQCTVLTAGHAERLLEGAGSEGDRWQICVHVCTSGREVLAGVTEQGLLHSASSKRKRHAATQIPGHMSPGQPPSGTAHMSGEAKPVLRGGMLSQVHQAVH